MDFKKIMGKAKQVVTSGADVGKFALEENKLKGALKDAKVALVDKLMELDAVPEGVAEELEAVKAVMAQLEEVQEKASKAKEGLKSATSSESADGETGEEAPAEEAPAEETEDKQE